MAFFDGPGTGNRLQPIKVLDLWRTLMKGRATYSTVATIYELNPMQAIEKQPPTPPKLTTEIGADGLNFPCIATPRRIHEESSTLEFIFM